jgi:cytochrome c-type biogenesis protein CcmH
LLSRAAATVLFWIIATAFVMIAMMAIFLPMLRAPGRDETQAALANALIAELADINTDNGARFGGPVERAAARAEIGRRLLALERGQKAEPARKANHLAFLFALVPIAAVPLYLALGQPEYGDQWFATRADRPEIEDLREVEGLIARVEERLRAAPDDARGWALIAPVYARLGRNDEAVQAYDNALKHFSGPALQRSDLLANRAEILVAKDSGTVAAAASTGFAEALALNADNQKALFYLAIAREQSGGNPDEARSNWQALIARFEQANPPWLGVARQRLAALGGAGPSASMPGPTAAEMEAAADLSAEEQQAMISGMVEQLADRLAENPDDSEGWMRLIRARVVMGAKEQAVADLANARAQFAAGTPDRIALDQAASALGL